MKKDKLIPLFYALALAVLLLAAFVPTGSFIYQYAPVQAVFPTTVYTETQTATSNALDLGKYGSLQVQTSVVATGTTTVIPQFSNELVPCSLVTTWVNATEQTLYTSATSGDTVTPTQVSVSLAWVLDASAADNRELVSLGRCFRLSVTSTGDFTPTGYLRMVQRN